MVHKRYIIKDGKRYGPYLYENKRVNGKVVSSYVKKPTLSLNIIVGILVAVILVVLLIFLSYQGVSGRVVLDIKTNYNSGDILNGNLKLSLVEGELIPADSKVILSLGGIEKEFKLSDVLDYNVSSGQFFAINSSLDGSGEGYGIQGSKKIYPDVDFELLISSQNETTNNESGVINESIIGDLNNQSILSNESISGNESFGGGSAGGPSNSLDNETSIVENPEILDDNNSSETPANEVPSNETSIVENPEAPVDSSNESSGGSDNAEEPEQEPTQPTEEPTQPVEEPEQEPTQPTEEPTQETGYGGVVSANVIREVEGFGFIARILRLIRLTGNVVSEQGDIISGNVRYGENYTHELDSGDKAFLVEGSAKYNGTAIGDNHLQLKNENDKVVVSTDYSIDDGEKGFGQDYIGSSKLELQIDLSKFGINVTNGTLIVKLVYSGNEIVSAQKEIGLMDEVVIENVSSNISLIKDIPTIRIYENENYSLDLGEYFEGTESYNLSEISNITGEIVSDILTIVPDYGFRGVRRARVSAYSGNESVESNQFSIFVYSRNNNITLSRGEIKLGQPVKWIQNVSLSKPEETVVEIPKEAKDVKILNVETGDVEEVEISYSGTITGNVIGINTDVQGFVSKLINKIVAGITGRAILEVNAEADIAEINLTGNSTSYIVEYYTPEPVAFEKTMNYGKQIVISGPELNYTDILSYTNISEVYNVGQEDRINIYWVENKSYVSFDAFDTDENGKLDYVEWITPHLSNQTFEIILITNAEHLDSNRIIIENVYDSVKKLDNVKASIPVGDYLRVRFEIPLNKSRDITLYASPNLTGINTSVGVRVYEKDGNTVIADFGEINESGRYRVLLTNLTGTNDIFDILVYGSVNSGVLFDYVIDPSLIIIGNAHWKMNDNTASTSIVDNLNGHTCTLQSQNSDALTTTGRINSALNNAYGGSYSCGGGTYQSASCSGDMDSYCNSWDGWSSYDCSSYSGGLCSMENQGYGNDCHPNPNCGDRTDEGSCTAASAVGCSWTGALDCSSLGDEGSCNAQGPTCSWTLSGQSYDYAVCDASTTWNTAPFTISFWTKGTGHGGHWLGMQSTGADAWRIEGGDTPYFVTDNIVTAQANTNFNDGNWHMATATMNESGFIRWYTDAKLESVFQATAVDGSSDTMELWKVGGDATYPFILDDVRFYSGELSVAQIRQIYNNGLGTEEELYFNSTAFNVTLNSTLISEQHYSFLDFENSIKGWWKGEGNALDSSGNGYTGTWSGTEAYASSSFNSSFNMSGASKINLGNLYTKRDFTLSMRINASDLSGTYRALFAQREGCTALNIQLYAKDSGDCAGGPAMAYMTTSAGNFLLCANAVLNVGQNYLLTEVYDGSQFRIYVDGALDNNMTAYGDFVASVHSYLGDDSCGNYFEGKIDEVLFFDRALSSDEVLALNASSSYYSNGFMVPSYKGDSNISSSILHYKLNDNSASADVVDSSGNGYTGTSSANTNTIDAAGKIDGSLTFSGNNIDVGSNFSSLSDGNFTVSTWFNTNANSWVDGVFSNGGSGTYHSMYFTSFHTSFGGMYYAWFDNTNTEQYFKLQATTPGIWHHMAVSKSGTSISFYYDGKLLEQKTTTATLAYPTNNLKIGTDNYGNNFGGKIDDFRLYDYGLTAGAIANIYNRGLGSENETFETYEYESKGYATNNSGYVYTSSNYTNYIVEGGTKNLNLNLEAPAPAADTTSPTINFSSPTENNGSVYSRTNIEINVTATDTNLANITIDLYNATGLVNSTTTATSPNYVNITSLPEGRYYFNATAYDLVLNANSTETRTVIVDINAPLISVVYPANITYNYTLTELNYTVSDVSPGSCWYSIDSGSTNVSVTCGNNVSALSPAQGNNIWKVWANDTLGNMNSSTRAFFLDTIYPDVNFTSPTPANGTAQVANSIYVNLSTSDTNQHYSFVDMDNSLMRWYRMDDVNSSGGVIDLSSYSNNGTNYNEVTQNSSGRFGKSMQFNGINQSVWAESVSSTVVSVCTWVKIEISNTVNSNNYLVAKFDPGLGKRVWGLWQTLNTNTIGFATSPTGSYVAGNLLVTSASMFDGNWHHICGIHNGTYNFLYVDGTLNVSVDATDGLYQTSSALAIGCASVSGACQGNDYFGGKIDEVIILNRSLSATEVASLYNAGVNKYENNFTGINNAVHSITGYAVDIAGNKNQTEQRSITVDTTIPLINFSSPTENNGSVYLRTNIEINVTATDTNLANITINLYNTTGLVNSTTTTTSPNYVNITSLPSGTYYFNATTYDLALQLNNTETRSLIIDATAPEINFTSPTPDNGSTINVNSIYANLSTIDVSNHYAFVDFDNSLLGWWRFGNNVNDELGVNNATWVGVANYTSGKFGETISLNGTYMHKVSIADKDYWDFPTDFTISSWVKWKTTCTNWWECAIIAHDQGGGNLPKWILSYDTSVSKTIFHIQTGNVVLYSNAWTLTPDTFYLISLTRNGSNYTFYRNGVIEGSSVSTTAISNANAPLTIGWGEGSTLGFNGSIDEVMIFNRSLSAVEVASLYNASVNKYEQNFTSLNEGVHTITGYAVDIFGSKNQTEQRSITVDTTLPLINFSSPTENNGSIYSRTNIEINVTATDTNLANITINLYNATGLVNSTTTTTSPNYVNITSLPSGTYYFNATAYDLVLNANSTETRSLIIDASAPEINFTSPTPDNASTQTNQDVYVNLSTNDTNQHYSFLDLDNSLLGWWRGEGNANDEMGISNGTLQGNANASSSGMFNSGFGFDGNGDYITFEGTFGGGFTNPNKFTIAAWMYAKTSPNAKTAWFGWNTLPRLAADNSNRIDFDPAFNGVDGQGTVQTANNSIQYNHWYHVAITYDKEEVVIYIDGVRSANKTFFGAYMPTSGGIFRIGGTPYANQYFNGSIDELLIFNRSLSSSEVASLYNSTANQYANNFTGLDFGNHSLTGYAVDIVGNKNQTETRIVNIVQDIDGLPPAINFTSPTPDNASTQTNQDAFVNMSTLDDSQHYSFLDLDNSLLGWWRFDNSTSAIDETGVNNGILNNGVGSALWGKFGKAYTFDGINDYVSLFSGCSGTPGNSNCNQFDNVNSCSAYSSHNGQCSSNYTCQGTPNTDCNVYVEEGTCGANSGHYGCSWTGTDTCSGTVTCEGQPTSEACADLFCSWTPDGYGGGTCSGTPSGGNSCSQWNGNSGECTEFNNRNTQCAWHMIDYICSGTAGTSACSVFSEPTDCGNENGCSWIFSSCSNVGDGLTCEAQGSYLSCSVLTLCSALPSGFPNSSLSEITISTWVNTEQTPVYNDGIVTKGNSSWRLSMYSSTGKVNFGTTGLTNSDLQSSALVNDGNWHLVSAVYNGTTKMIYIDGVLDASIAASGSISNNNYDVWFGSNSEQTAWYFNGSIDEVLVFNRSLAANEIASLYNSNVKQYANNFTELAEGIHNFTGYAVDSAGNKNQTETREINVQLNVAPNNPVVYINSTDGSNKSAQDLNCFATLSDNDANAMNVSVEWYKNGAFDLSINYTSNYANGTLFNASLANGNTTKGENWSCGMKLFDGRAYSGWVNSSSLLILNTLPTVTLDSPSDAYNTTDRTPSFNWTGSDDDADSLTYEFNISLVAGSTCEESDRVVGGLSTNYTLTSNLKCFADNNDYYVWSVRANDGEGDGAWSGIRKINISAVVDISLPVDNVNFRSLDYLASNDTSDDSPPPFVIQNDGNALVNISVSANPFWESIANPNEYYKFKIDNKSGEEGAFNWVKSLTSWFQMPTAAVIGITELNYSDNTDSAEVDLYIQVPPEEGPGNKSSIVTFVSSLAE